MARWQPIPIVGGSYSDDTRPFSSQLTVNWLPVRAERPGGRSESMLRTPPGLDAFLTVGAGPIRGIHNAEGKLFVVSGNTLYRVGHQEAPQVIGTIAGTRRVQMSHNQRDGGNELIVVNGESGYTYNTAKNTFAKITDEGYPGAGVVRYIGQYFVQIEPQRRFWFHSDLADGTSYNTLDRYEAESSPDRLQTLEVNQGQLIVFGERTCEVWENSPFQADSNSYTTVFQRATVIERGAASAHATAVMDNTVYFVGSDGIVYYLDGYTPSRISTSAEEQELAKHNLADVFTFVWEDRGHKVFYVTCPTGRTMGFDVSSREWSDRRSYGRDRWRVNALAEFGGDWIAGSYQSGELYRLDWGVFIDGGEVMESFRRTGALHADQNRVRLNAVELVFDTGTCAVVDPFFLA